MGKTIERYNLNIKLYIPLFFFSTLERRWRPNPGAHRHSHAPSRVRAAHACSYHYLCHEQKRLCPLVSHETDEPSSRPAQKQNSVLAATAVSARIRADQVAGGMHPHITSSSREEKHDHDGRARRWWREVPPRPNATHCRVAKTLGNGGFCDTPCTVR